MKRKLITALIILALFVGTNLETFGLGGPEVVDLGSVSFYRPETRSANIIDRRTIPGNGYDDCGWCELP